MLARNRGGEALPQGAGGASRSLAGYDRSGHRSPPILAGRSTTAQATAKSPSSQTAPDSMLHTSTQSPQKSTGKIAGKSTQHAAKTAETPKSTGKARRPDGGSNHQEVAQDRWWTEGLADGLPPTDPNGALRRRHSARAMDGGERAMGKTGRPDGA